MMAIILAQFFLLKCDKNNDHNLEGIHFNEEMRLFVEAISKYAKNKNSDFIIIPQNGQELITTNGEEDGNPNWEGNYKVMYWDEAWQAYTDRIMRVWIKL